LQKIDAWKKLEIIKPSIKFARKNKAKQKQKRRIDPKTFISKSGKLFRQLQRSAQ
jgi:hypothetical protein